MMNKKYNNFLHKAHQDVLVVEILTQDVDVLAETIVFHAHRAIQHMLWNIFETNGAKIVNTQDLASILRDAIDNHWMCVNDDEMQCAVLLSQYANIVQNEDSSNIKRDEALKAIMLCNRLADVIRYNGYPSFEINSCENVEVPYFKSPRRINLSSIILDRIVENIISAVPTETIYIFGSYARREEHKDSDIDIYVVTNNSKSSNGLNMDDMSEVRKALYWLDKPKDIFCMSKEDFDEFSQKNTGLERRVVNEGIKIYERRR